MASVHATLYDRMTAYTGLTDLVGTRIYRQPVPLHVDLPAVTYQLISSRRMRAAGGAVHVVERVQVNCWADTPDDADAVADEIVSAFDHWRDESGSVQIRQAKVADQQDMHSGDSEKDWRVVDLLIARSV